MRDRRRFYSSGIRQISYEICYLAVQPPSTVSRLPVM